MLHANLSILLYLRKGVGGRGGQERGRRDASSQHAAITASVASNHEHDRVQVHASTCRTRQPRTSGGEIFQNVLGPWFRRGLTRGPAADPGLLNILSHPCRASPTPRAQPGYLQHFRRMVDALHVSSSKLQSPSLPLDATEHSERPWTKCCEPFDESAFKCLIVPS